MKGFFLMIFLIFFGFYLGLSICNYKSEEIRLNAVKTGINESMKLATNNSLDRSVRTEIDSTKAKLIKEKFIDEFEKNLKNNLNIKLENPELYYDFLENDEGTQMVRVTLKDKIGREYRKVYRLC